MNKELRGTVRVTNSAFFTFYSQVRAFAEYYNLPMTTRQASKFRNKRGILYRAWKEAQNSLRWRTCNDTRTH